ncbi:PEPxxWA-CTERM sorting domain-containing protein [Sphingosinicellaceae bacterium]|nr:PEPxxWA-CTERM sorting domain-containing protein [Sphingosinicellaceae bacterium]
MNPYTCGGRNGFVTGLDLAALDAIGWNTTVDVAHYSESTADFLGFVPEPATWALMLGGFGFVGTALRRQRRTGYATA